jgi:hypothetical protein
VLSEADARLAMKEGVVESVQQCDAGGGGERECLRRSVI